MAHKRALAFLVTTTTCHDSTGHKLSGMNRSRLLLILLLFIAGVLVALLVSWRSEALDIDISSHAEVASEYVKHFFNTPQQDETQVAQPRYIPPDAVRIYIGIVLFLFVCWIDRGR